MKMSSRHVEKIGSAECAAGREVLSPACQAWDPKLMHGAVRAFTAAVFACLTGACGSSTPGPSDSGSNDPREPVECTGRGGGLPRPLDLPEAEPNGVYDPSLARDPESGRLWMAYSSVTGPAGTGRVSIHLAYTDDEGATWCHQGVVKGARSVPRQDQPEAIAKARGHWSHEVASIGHDGAADPSQRWMLVWHRYLHVDDEDPATDDRRFAYGWIAQRTAARAEDLLNGAETQLFAGAAYSADPEIRSYNQRQPGGTPVVEWWGHPALGDCLALTEPALLPSDGGLYLAAFCARLRGDSAIVLTRKVEGAWRYEGRLLDASDAQVIDPGFDGFNAPDLVDTDGGIRLIASPVRSGLYQGCAIYDVDLSSVAVSDRPRAVLPRSSDANVFQTGACTYDGESPLGLLVGDVHRTDPQFRLRATGQHL